MGKSINYYMLSIANEFILIALRQRQYLTQIREIIHKTAPFPPSQQNIVISYRNGKLLIYAVNGVIGIKLKQLLPTLHEELLKEGLKVTQIQIKVQPDVIKRYFSNKPKKHCYLSDSAKNSLKRLIEKLEPTSSLKKSLAKMINSN